MSSSNPQQLRIAFLGVQVAFESHLPAPICPVKALQIDFQAMIDIQTENAASHTYRVILKPLNDVPEAKWCLPLKIHWRGKTINWVSQNGTHWLRQITCSDGSRIQIVDGLLVIYTSSQTTAHQLAFQYGLALLGEELERQGFVRLHAMTYESPNKKGTLVLADSGIGKSTLAAQLQQKNKGHVRADELTFFKDDKLYPCPLPIAVSTDQGDLYRSWQPNKNLMPLKEPVEGNFILDKVISLDGRAGSKEQDPELQKLSPSRIFKIVVGLGLPQMLEIMVRKNNIGFLFRTVLLRLKAAIRLNRKPVYLWKLDLNDSLRATRVAQWLTRQN